MNSANEIFVGILTIIIFVFAIFSTVNSLWLLWKGLIWVIVYWSTGAPPNKVDAEDKKKFEDVKSDSGFAFFDVADDKKVIFLDTMNGFRDFAMIKGYGIEVDINSGMPGKVGVKIVILDTNTAISKAAVKKDVTEYIERLHSGGELDDMPMIIDEAEHRRLVLALKSRFSFVRLEAELQRHTAEFYKGLYEGAQRVILSGVEYGRGSIQTTHVYIRTGGDKTMSKSYAVTNSPGAAVGKGSSVSLISSSIHVGKTEEEKNIQIETVEDLVNTVNLSDLSGDLREKVVRSLKNIQDELGDSSPDQMRIKKWLETTGKIINDTNAGVNLIEKFNDLVNRFLISF